MTLWNPINLLSSWHDNASHPGWQRNKLSRNYDYISSAPSSLCCCLLSKSFSCCWLFKIVFLTCRNYYFSMENKKATKRRLMPVEWNISTWLKIYCAWSSQQQKLDECQVARYKIILFSTSACCVYTLALISIHSSSFWQCIIMLCDVKSSGM